MASALNYTSLLLGPPNCTPLLLTLLGLFKLKNTATALHLLAYHQRFAYFYEHLFSPRLMRSSTKSTHLIPFDINA